MRVGAGVVLLSDVAGVSMLVDAVSRREAQ